LTKLAKYALLAATFALCVLSLATVSAAQTLSGTVTNGTTNKPAAGDEVILINIANGMDVAANTKTDSAGKFTFKLTDAGGPHLIRAVHQGVNYHQMAPPGTSNVEVHVYDVAKKVEGLSLTADVLRFQADKTSMQGIRLFVVSNNSTPPVTQMNDRNFEFYLPPGAKVEQLQARAPNGQPIAAEVVPQSEKNRYAVNFPLRPGDTQFQLEYTLPYKGTAKIDPRPLMPAEHLVVVLPKTMHFAAADSTSFKSMNDPNQPDTVVQVAQQVKAGQSIPFTITGTGTISDQQQGGSGDQQAQGGPSGGPMNENPQAESTRPGGGLGAPIDAPDPLEKYRWPIIGAFIVLLAVGGWIVTKRQTGIHAAAGPGASARSAFSAPITGPGARAIAEAGTIPSLKSTPAAASPAVAGSSSLLEAIKEELFQLEVERKQGKITDAEYQKAKDALDHTLERALKRKS
jgi:hypothetical protein